MWVYVRLMCRQPTASAPPLRHISYLHTHIQVLMCLCELLSLYVWVRGLCLYVMCVYFVCVRELSMCVWVRAFVYVCVSFIVCVCVKRETREKSCVCVCVRALRFMCELLFVYMCVCVRALLSICVNFCVCTCICKRAIEGCVYVCVWEFSFVCICELFYV